MKKTIIILLILIAVAFNGLFLQMLNRHIPATTHSVSEYAQIKYNNACLYKTPEETDKLFLLEETYFVKIINSYNEKYYEVEYMDLTGFVKKNEVQFVKETPSFPYLDNITFSTGNTTTDLMNWATDDGEIIAQLSPNTQNITYYGKIAGKQLDSSLGNIWYYCKVNINNINQYGYVYSSMAKNLSSIITNTETFTPVANIVSNPMESLLYLNLSTQNILIITVCLPTILLLILLLKRGKLNVK